jgi:type IV fimbrial biogenesis protein FimT
VVLTLGIPSFGAIVANQRLRTEVDKLFHAIHHARKESVVRRRVVTICPTIDGENCGDDWSRGWMMFVNIDRDWPAKREPDEPVIKWLEVAPENRIVANRRSFSLRSVDLRATNGTLVFCDRAGRARPRALVVSYTGRPRVAYADRRGRPYSCPD